MDLVVSHDEFIEILCHLPYKVYLKTDHWSCLRAAILERDGHKCQDCNSSRRLDVHHLTYERRGCELPEDLITLCRDCHGKRHKKGKHRCQHLNIGVLTIFGPKEMDLYWACVDCQMYAVKKEPTKEEKKRQEQYRRWIAGECRCPRFVNQ